jgi:hypothetical protein
MINLPKTRDSVLIINVQVNWQAELSTYKKDVKYL